MNFKNKKGFTIVELIVVMAVIAVLVLLAMPKFMGHTKEARLTELKSNIKTLEDASERYYMDTNVWPKLTEEHYTKEELEAFSKEIKNRTGFNIELDPEGKYYPISYKLLQKYVQEPSDMIQYIIQNPVGEVFYIDGIPKDVHKDYEDSIIDKGGIIEQPIETPTNPPDEPIEETPIELEPSPSSWFLVSVTGELCAGDELKNAPGPVDVIIPKVWNGITVTSIKDGGFSNLSNIGKVVIPNGVTHIGKNAFHSSSLSEIEIPNTVTSLGERVFRASSIKNVTIPSSITSIPDGTFYDCVNLESVTLPDGLISIGAYAFYKTGKISNLNIPSTVTTIDFSAVIGWSHLQTLTIKARDNKQINIFDWNSGAKVLYEDSDDYFVTENGAVYKSNLLGLVPSPVNLDIPSEINGIKTSSIKDRGFSYLSNIGKVVIPNGVTHIGHYAFDSSSLSEIEIPNTVTSLGVYVFDDSSIKNATIPSSITSIPTGAFYNCTKLESVTLPDGLISIGPYAFHRTSKISNLNIPSTVTTMGSYAFYEWSPLQTLTLIGRTNTSGMTLDFKWNESATIVYK